MKIKIWFVSSSKFTVTLKLLYKVKNPCNRQIKCACFEQTRGITPGWWVWVSKAQLPCLKERHALRHNLCSRTPLWIRLRLGLRRIAHSADSLPFSVLLLVGVPWEPFFNTSLVPEFVTQSPLPGKLDLIEQVSIRWIFKGNKALCWIKYKNYTKL